MSEHGPCHCKAHSGERKPAAKYQPVATELLAPLTPAQRVDFDAFEQRRRIGAAAHEIGHAIAFAAFGARIEYATAGGNVAHVSCVDYGPAPTVIGHLISLAAGHVADEAYTNRVRRPGVLALGAAVRRDDGELGSCDTCQMARILRAFCPSCDPVDAAVTLYGTCELAADCFEQPTWRRALDELAPLLQERVILTGEDIEPNLNRAALSRDFEAAFQAFDVERLLPAFRNVERGRDDLAAAAPVPGFTPFTGAGATHHHEARPCA